MDHARLDGRRGGGRRDDKARGRDGGPCPQPRQELSPRFVARDVAHHGDDGPVRRLVLAVKADDLLARDPLHRLDGSHHLRLYGCPG